MNMAFDSSNIVTSIIDTTNTLTKTFDLTWTIFGFMCLNSQLFSFGVYVRISRRIVIVRMNEDWIL